MMMNYEEYDYVEGCKNYNHYIAEYIDIVEQEKVKTCIEQKLLIKYVKKRLA